MTNRKKAIKALIWLMVVLAVCMFFARTLQTITTAKVEKIKAVRAKMEDHIKLDGKVHFEKGEDVVIKEAKGMGAGVEKVLAKEGYFVKKGDLMVTLSSQEFEGKMEALQTEHQKAAHEWSEETAKTIRLPQVSYHNELHQKMLEASDAYFEKRAEALRLAHRFGVTLPEDIQAWGETPDTILRRVPKGQPDTVTPDPIPTPMPPVAEDKYPGLGEAVKAAHDAYVAQQQSMKTLYNLYMGIGGTRIGIATFESIAKRDAKVEEMKKIEEKMFALSEKNEAMQNVYAPHDGYVTKMDIKVGDSYDGLKPLFVISKEGDAPSLRADVTDIKKTLKKGMKAKVEGLQKDVQITDVLLDTDKRRYAVISLTEKQVTELGGLNQLMTKEVPMTLVYKSDKTTTLIPASALRTDDGGKHFVYVIENSWGGMLGNNQLKVKKVPVTVLEKSDKMVSLSDDLSYAEIADHEDRTIKDGLQVMEYVD